MVEKQEKKFRERKRKGEKKEKSEKVEKEEHPSWQAKKKAKKEHGVLRLIQILFYENCKFSCNMQMSILQFSKNSFSR